MFAFILGDMLGSGSSIFGSSRFEIGEIADETIAAQDFERQVQEAIENYKEQANQTSLDQATIDFIREQTWSQLLNKIVLGNEYKKLGIAVHPDEIFDLVTGSNPHPSIVQAFSNPETGEFNPNNVISFLKNMDNDPTGASRAQWITFEVAIKKSQMGVKYNNLIAKGLFSTSIQAKKYHDARNRTAKFRYVLQRYINIPDSLVKVEESDIENYYNEHKKEYEQEASRTFEYVVFDVLPLVDDTLNIKDWINRKYQEFKEVENKEDIESFVNMNADTRFQDIFTVQGKLPDMIDTVMFSADTGTVLEPYIEAGAYKTTKLIEIQYRPDSVKARHILIKPILGNKDSALVIADSLKELVQNGEDFVQLVKDLSEDKGSAVNDGDLGWFAEGTMVKPINDACFSGKTGDFITIESGFGAHLIEILDQTESVKKVRIATIDRFIEPSSKTFAGEYAKASRFAGEVKDKELFSIAVEEKGLVTRIADEIKESDKTIIGLDSPRELIRWAYKAEKGSVSEPFEMGNKFVVALLTEIKEGGNAPLEQIEVEIEVAVIKEKKARLIIEKINANDDEDIDDMAYNLSANDKNLDLTVENADITFSSFSIPGIGREPEVIGHIFGLQKGVMSEPIQGNLGVYVLVVEDYSDPSAADNYNFQQNLLIRNLQSRVDYEVFNALEKKANVVDNRFRFY